ncbi:MAG: HD domain-containing protein, partial [bacterium]|nr:HD domain-containing protein [bacterium]
SEGFKLFGGEITISDKNLFDKNPSAMMRLFELSQLHGVQIHSFARECLRKSLDRIDDEFRASPDVNRSFMNILKSEWDVTGSLKLMHKLEVLDRFIPEFGEVRCQVQHDIYHIYTVDTHSLFAVEELRRLMLGEQKEAYPVRTALMEELERPEVLYLAALLHDVGKGKGGRHEEIGARIAAAVAERLGFSKDDIDDIEFLVLNHLKLSHTAQRRDLSDAKLILDFAMEIGSLERGKMLYLLTYADIRAIGPDVWTEWKSDLFHELYTKTAEVFEKGVFDVKETKERIRKVASEVEQIIGRDYPEKGVRAFMRSMPERYLLSNTPTKIAEHFTIAMRHVPPLSVDLKHNERRGYTRLIVTTIDAPGLFYKISGVLSGNGINILAADIYTRKNGEVFDIFHVQNTIEGIPIDNKRWARVESDLLDVIQGAKKAEDIIKEFRKPSILGGKYIPGIKPRVIINNEISDSNTVIEIFAEDRIGLLYTISKILVKQGLYIEVSKISTMGKQITDVFYLKDIFGQKVFYREKLDEVKRELLNAIEEGETWQD